MKEEVKLIELQGGGQCWWCGALADSREHKYKRSDLVREFGRPPYHGERTLSRLSGDDRHHASGPNSPIFQFPASMCSGCNGTRSQPFDTAWDQLTAYLAANEESILASRSIDLEDVFGRDWQAHALHAGRYVVKHMISRQIGELPGPLRMDEPVMGFLDGGPWPESFQLDLCLDLGVVEMLRTTRRAPSEDPEAAEGGFLYVGPVFVDLDEDRHWHTPQSVLYYRWLAAYWRIGDGGPNNPFRQRMVYLKPTDELFGESFRELLAAQLEVPREVLDAIPDEQQIHDGVRAAGYAEIADRLEVISKKIAAERDTDDSGDSAD